MDHNLETDVSSLKLSYFQGNQPSKSSMVLKWSQPTIPNLN